MTPPLDPAIGRKILDWFRARGIGQTCPVCGGTTFDVSGLFAMRMVDQAGQPVPGVGATFAPLTCVGCGYSQLFSAAYMGLIPHLHPPTPGATP
jgi:hypothetical protein